MMNFKSVPNPDFFKNSKSSKTNYIDATNGSPGDLAIIRVSYLGNVGYTCKLIEKKGTDWYVDCLGGPTTWKGPDGVTRNNPRFCLFSPSSLELVPKQDKFTQAFIIKVTSLSLKQKIFSFIRKNHDTENRTNGNSWL